MTTATKKETKTPSSSSLSTDMSLEDLRFLPFGRELVAEYCKLLEMKVLLQDYDEPFQLSPSGLSTKSGTNIFYTLDIIMTCVDESVTLQNSFIITQTRPRKTNWGDINELLICTKRPMEPHRLTHVGLRSMRKPECLSV